jgi:FkbM family methyltransferase
MSYIERIGLRLRRMLPTPDCAVRTMRGGYRLNLRPNSDPFERQLYVARTYEPGTLSLFDKVLREGDTMVDVGANLGLMTLHAAGRVGPTGAVVAIEPHPAYFPRLLENVALNGLRNVRAVEVAAGDVTEERTIFDIPSANIGRSSLARPEVDSEPAGSVSVRPLDDILDDQKADFVRLLKIDVEGFEPQVLRGASRTIAMQPIVCMEVSAALDHGEDGPLAAHDILMSTGLYSSYGFLHGKGRASPLVEITERDRLALQMHDNVVYLPHALRGALPLELFADRSDGRPRGPR